jgi:predicted anti-sigma-YlaC factor YlaD
MSDHNGCRDMLGDLSDYLDREASAALCAEIDKHLADCENCRVVVDTLSHTIMLYRTLPHPEMSESLRERLYKTLDLQPFFRPKDQYANDAGHFSRDGAVSSETD